MIIAICFITALSRVPFQNFFQAITIQSFISACIGGVLGTAILGHSLKVLIKKNTMLLSSNIDNVNIIAANLPKNELYGMVYQQSVMVSIKVDGNIISEDNKQLYIHNVSLKALNF